MQSDHSKTLRVILNAYSPVSQSGVDLVMENGSLQSFKKNEIIFAEKKYNAFEYFQIQGISHRYNTCTDLQTISTGIYLNQTVITPHFARTINGQSIFSLQTLTECIYIKVPIGSFDDLRAKHQQIRAFGQKVVENEFIRNLNYDVIFRSYTARERLLFFRTNFPNLENIVPHTVIASFLGITPVSFSRLRNELTKEGL